jgi:hypothetical protein
MVQYFCILCAITCEKTKDPQRWVIGFIVQKGPMANATLLFIVNLKNDICKSKDVVNRTFGTKA